MTKSLVTKLYLIGIVVWIVGAILIFASIAGNASHQAGPLTAVGYLLAFAGGIASLIAWIVALILTAQAKRWGWFVAILVLSLIGLGIFVMLAYIVAGPREGAAATSSPAPA